MEKLNLIKRFKDRKKKKLERKVQKKESNIRFLKYIDEQLAEITLDNLTVRKKPVLSKKASFEEHSLYYRELQLHRIEKELMKWKKKYLQIVEAYTEQVDSLKKLETDLANIGIVDHTLKFDVKNDSMKKKLNKLNRTLKKIQAKPSTKEYGYAILSQIQSFLNDLPHSTKFVIDEDKNEKLTKKFRKQLLAIKKVYTKKLMAIEKSKPVIAKKEAKYTEVYEHNVYRIKVRIAHITHQIKVLNDVLWWMNLSKEEQKERRCDLSFYVPDTIGYWLTLISVVAEIVYLILLLSGMTRTFWVGATILINIAFLLLLFTVAIKVKNYKKTFSYISIAFGLYCILRISYVIHGLMGVDLSAMSVVKLIFIYGANAYMIIASIFVGIRSYIKIKRQMTYLSENKITQFQLSK